jgi:predicted permease
LAAGAGYALGRRFQLDLRSLSRVAFYVFSPCLVFSSLTHSDLAGPTYAQIGAVSLGATIAIALIAYLAGLALRLDRVTRATLIVAATFGNAGNFGLAVSQFAFGDAALARAVVYYVFNSLAVYTLGVAVAASGQRSWPQVLRHALFLPTTLAVILAVLMRLFGVAVPQPVDRAVGLLSQSAIPVMLMLLGLQLAGIHEFPRSRLGLIGLAALSQLVVAPLVTLGLATALQLNGVTLQAVVVESAMPTAVITTILAVEYDLDMALVSGTVVLSTLLSPLTITPLIAFLQRR